VNWLILTDLDGSLLDLDTYQWAAAQPALDRIRRDRIPLGFVSSKTLREIENLRAQIDLPGPDISENGALIRFPDGEIERMGTPIRDLRRSLDEMAVEIGFEPRRFEDGGIEGVMRETGLSREDALAALDRQGDEPFKAPGADPGAIAAAARARGLHVLRGDRYYHLVGHEGKGVACDRLLAWYRSRGGAPRVLGVGDASNDIAFLQLCDVSVCIPHPDGLPDPELVSEVPGVRVAPVSGPGGWSRAVLSVLDDSRNGHDG